MRLFDRFYVLYESSGPDVKQNRVYIPEPEVDEWMDYHARVYREDGIWGNILRWIRS